MSDPTPSGTGDPAALLGEIRERHDKIRTGTYSARAALADAVADMPRLLAAVEAVLKLADDWDAEAQRIDGIFAGEEDPWPRTVSGMRSQAFEQCAKTLREAIRTALAGEAGDNARTS